MTGDAVNVAARLEQAAEAGEIVIGEETLSFVRDAVAAEPIGPLELKGKSEPISAYRVLDVVAGAEGRVRRLDSPMVGRRRALAVLEQASEGSVADATCYLVTVLGPAGVGKTRLVEEFLASLPAAAVYRGRCLPYGEGTTFFPLVESSSRRSTRPIRKARTCFATASRVSSTTMSTGRRSPNA